MEIKGPFGEEVVFKNTGLKALLKKTNHYFFVDSCFKTHECFKESRSNVCFLKAGESLKTLGSYEKMLKWLHKNNVDKRATLVAIGGGSVGDSVGFLASTYLRGVSLVHIPTTWLSAVDSSIGGKTALNVGGYKNQIGTVYPPKKVVFFKDLLKTSNVQDSKGEVLKTLFLNIDKKWSKSLLSLNSIDQIKFEDLMFFIKYKIQVVKKDPFDIKGVRAVLNFGHSLAHALELKFNLSHSKAVEEGLRFAVLWSVRKRHLSDKAFAALDPFLVSEVSQMPLKDLETVLRKDKKALGDKINFIFLSDKGPLVKKVSIKSMVKEYERQLKERVLK